MSCITNLDQVENLLSRTGKKNSSQLVIKRLHDDMLSSFRGINEEKLVIQNLNNQQIWQQLNSHLNETLPQWDRFLERVAKQMKREKEQRLRQQEQEDVGDMQQEEDEEAQEGEIDDGDQEGMMEEEPEDQEEPVDQKMLEMEEEDDVGLYGEQLDQQDDEDDEADNQFDQDDSQLKNMRDQQEIQDDNLEDENFEHFRQVQMQNLGKDQQDENADHNREQQQAEPTDEISRLQSKLLGKKDWKLKGEVASKDRPIDSLIDTTLQFKRGIKPAADVDEQYNSEIEQYIKQRVLDQLYDDRARYEFAPGFREHFTALPEISTEKNKQSLGELYEQDFKNSLGLKQSKQQKLKNQIMQMFKQLNYKLDCLTNFNFMPKPVIKEATITNEPYILKEQKIPITVAKQMQDGPQNLRRELKSDKELQHKDRKAARQKNKRISRQRKKERDAKKANRSIEYGGQTKFQAEARKKIQKNKQTAKKVKYAQSGQFFKTFQQNTANKTNSKPNPNINKIKM